jgi:hypothetical protein
MDYHVRNFNEKNLKQSFSSYVLGVDIGGTNTNLGIAGVNNVELTILFSLHFKTKELDSLVLWLHFVCFY